MRQLILSVPEKKFRFVMELVSSLSFIKVEEKKSLTKDELEFISDIKQSMKEVDLHLKKRIKLKSAKEALNEL